MCPTCNVNGIFVPHDRVGLVPLDRVRQLANRATDSPWSSLESGMQFRSFAMHGHVYAVFATKAPGWIVPLPVSCTLPDGTVAVHLKRKRDALVLPALHDVPAQPPAAAATVVVLAPQTAARDAQVCWGTMLAGDDAQRPCAAPKEGNKFRHKFCEVCLSAGILVPEARVRVATQGDETRTSRQGIWYTGTYARLRHRNVSPGYVVFDRPADRGARVPAHLVQDGMVRLVPQRDGLVLRPHPAQGRP